MREVKRSAQGELEMAGLEWLRMRGGMKLQSRRARVNPSRKAKGNSREKLSVGTVGSSETTVPAPKKSPVYVGDGRNEGVSPNSDAAYRKYQSTIPGGLAGLHETISPP